MPSCVETHPKTRVLPNNDVRVALFAYDRDVRVRDRHVLETSSDLPNVEGLFRRGSFHGRLLRIRTIQI